MKLKELSIWRPSKMRALFSEQYSELDYEITSLMNILFNWNAFTSGCDILLHCVLSNQSNVQILDVQHKPIKMFVSGLSLQFLRTPTVLLRKARYSG